MTQIRRVSFASTVAAAAGTNVISGGDEAGLRYTRRPMHVVEDHRLVRNCEIAEMGSTEGDHFCHRVEMSVRNSDNITGSVNEPNDDAPGIIEFCRIRGMRYIPYRSHSPRYTSPQAYGLLLMRLEARRPVLYM